MVVDRRYRVGVLVPQGSIMHEAEFRQMPHNQVEFRFEGFALPVLGAAAFCAELVAAVSAPMAALRRWGADLMLLGCTTASMSCEDTPWRRVLADLAGVPLVTAAGASRAAFAALGLHRVAVATPYGPLSNEIVRRFLEESSIEVDRLEGMGLDSTADRWSAVPTLTADHILNYSLLFASVDIDGLYLPCTAMASVAVVNGYEKETGKVATSSVQASYWFALKELNLPLCLDACGRLLRSVPSE